MTAPDSRDSVELLPCPSCGGAAELRREHGRDVSLTWIECSACPIRTASRGWLGSDEAIVDALAYAWNNRPALARGPQQAGGEDAWSALETWLGTFADSIPAQAYHELCAIQRTIAADKAFLRGVIDSGRQQQSELLQRAETAEAALREESARLDYIERTFSGMTNRERYIPVTMIWGKGCNGRTLREACDKYMKRNAALNGGQDDA